MAVPLDADRRLQQLEADVAELKRRLQALSANAGSALRSVTVDSPPLPEASGDEVDATDRPAADVTRLATLMGRTCIVFGGAYLLRALTESGRLPGTAGVMLGLVYALVWLGAAARGGLRKASTANTLSREFHGVTGLLVGLPLVWEATVRFGLLGPASAALALAILSGLAFGVASRAQLPAVSGVAGVGAMAAACVIAWATAHYAVFAILLIGLSTTTYWLSEAPGRAWLRWPNAVMAGLGVAGVTTRALQAPPLEPLWLVLLTQGLLVLTMQGAIAARVLVFGRPVRFFDVMQAASALIIGIGGAILVGRGSTAGLGLIGAVTALLASGAYLAAIIRLRDRPHLTRSFHTFATWGLVGTATAIVAIFSGPALVAVALVCSMLTLTLGPRYLRGDAPLHGATYVMVALAASGALTAGVRAWLLTPIPWPSLTLTAWCSVLVTALCATLSPRRAGEVGDLLTRLGRLTIAAVSVFVVGGGVLTLIGPLVAGTPADVGILASVRTVLVSITIVILGALARWPQTRVFAHLIYPLIVLGGVRLVADDFVHSRPATLFVALACFGVALTIGPRIAAQHNHD